MELKDVETILKDNPEALKVVQGLNTRAALLTPEVEAALPKLKDFEAAASTLADLLGKSGAKDPAALIAEHAALKAEKAAMETKLAAIKSGKETPEQLALKEQIGTLQKAIDDLKKDNETKTANETRAIAEKRQTDLESAIVAAASKANMDSIDEKIIVLKGKGMTGIGEDGKPFFRKVNDKGELVAVKNAEEMIAALALARKDWFKGSGVKGAGGEHRGGGDENKFSPSTHKDAVADFLNG